MAQSRTETVEYLKMNREAIVTEIPFSEKTIAAAIQDTLQKLGYKGKESKDFMVYKAVMLPVFGKRSYDLYFSIERKSKKEKESSVVTLLVARDFDNFITMKSDPDVMDNAKTYMDSLRNIVAVYDLEQQIIAQEDVVKKSEKKLQGLIDDGEDYEKAKKKLEDKIDTNKKDRAKQKSDNELESKVLETLKARRKS
jgi:hypothetical protein